MTQQHHVTLPLPVLKLAQWHQGGAARVQFVEELGRAAREYGFFYLTDHGIPAAQIEQVMTLSQQFFQLPAAQKQQVAMVNSPHFRGYSTIGSELTNGRSDQREQFDYMQEEKALDPAAMTTHWHHLIGPNQWPSALPSMRDTLLTWQQQLSSISMELLEAFALALEQAPTAFHRSIGEQPYTHTKLIRYPQRPGNNNQGVGAHKDPGYLTLVLQDEQSGLEVQHQGEWLSVVPLPGAFVVNIGELLELASDGYLQATYHRVVSPNNAQERYSIAFFMAAQLAAEVPYLALPAHLKRLAQGPSSDPNTPLFRQVGQNVFKGRLRSHPDVAQRFYSELLKNAG